MYSLMITFVTYLNGGIINTTSQIAHFETKERAEKAFLSIDNTVSSMGRYEAVRLY